MPVPVVDHVGLDGDMQSPGWPDEDTRGGFALGGWAAGPEDPDVGSAMASATGPGFAWLFGRRSDDDMLGHWNAVGGPHKNGLNAARKYVASSDPDARLRWPNSELLTGDVPAAVAALRERSAGNLVVMGSGVLVRSLLPHGLVDEIPLVVHPLTLGSGRRLFPDDGVPRRVATRC